VQLPDSTFHAAHARAQAKAKVKKLTEKLQNHDLESQPGRTLMESFESQVGHFFTSFKVVYWGMHRGTGAREFGVASYVLAH
jgi:hypothetical protein